MTGAIVPLDGAEAEVAGQRALHLTGTLLTHVNQWRAARKDVEDAVAALEEHPGPDAFVDAALRRAAREGHGYTPIMGLPKRYRLPLEMAGHEKVERRAMEGELEELERAWREAEEIAAIADDLRLLEEVTEWIDPRAAATDGWLSGRPGRRATVGAGREQAAEHPRASIHSTVWRPGSHRGRHSRDGDLTTTKEPTLAPMLAVYAPSKEALTRLRPRLPRERTARLTTDWNEFLSCGGDAVCGVVMAPRLRAPLLRRLHGWRRRWPDTPLVLAVQMTASVLPGLSGLPVSRFVSHRVSAEELATAIRQARDARFLERAARAFEASDRLPPPLGPVLALACRTRPPHPSVQSLSRVGDVTPSALRRQLQRAGLESAPPTPKFVLDWIVVLRAAPRATASSWEATAEVFRMSSRTLRRIVKRRAGMRPGEIDGADLPRLRAGFREEVLDPLLGPDASKLTESG